MSSWPAWETPALAEGFARQPRTGEAPGPSSPLEGEPRRTLLVEGEPSERSELLLRMAWPRLGRCAMVAPAGAARRSVPQSGSAGCSGAAWLAAGCASHQRCGAGVYARPMGTEAGMAVSKEELGLVLPEVNARESEGRPTPRLRSRPPRAYGAGGDTAAGGGT